MNRLQARLFTMTVITGLIATLAGCGGSNRGLTGPTSSSGPTGPPRPSGTAYTIAGVITEYRGGPVSGVNVTAVSTAFSGVTWRTQTDQQGRYSLAISSAEPTLAERARPSLVVARQGYQSAWKYSVSTEDSTANFVLHPSVFANTSGAAFAGTMWGDEFMAGDDVLFGGLCAHTPCKVIGFHEFIGAPRQFEVRLRWADPTRQLALYHFKGDPDSISLDQPGERYCCSSELVATLSVSGYFDVIAVAFERAGGGSPSATDSQPFELTVRPIP